MTFDRRSAWPFALLGTVLVLAGLVAFIFWRIETWPARTAAGISEAFRDTFEFDPQITIDEDVIVEQSSDIAELAVLERTLVVERGYENRWLFSTKRLRARGTYTAKAGFDLAAGVDVTVDKNAEVVRVEFPAPELLSLEQENLEILEWQNGLWNKLNEQDAGEAVNGMSALARQRAEAEGLLAAAETSVASQLTARLQEHTDLKVEISFREP